jgi:hypothetical protein
MQLPPRMQMPRRLASLGDRARLPTALCAAQVPLARPAPAPNAIGMLTLCCVASLWRVACRRREGAEEAAGEGAAKAAHADWLWRHRPRPAATGAARARLRRDADRHMAMPMAMPTWRAARGRGWARRAWPAWRESRCSRVFCACRARVHVMNGCTCAARRARCIAAHGGRRRL